MRVLTWLALTVVIVLGTVTPALSAEEPSTSASPSPSASPSEPASEPVDPTVSPSSSGPSADPTVDPSDVPVEAQSVDPSTGSPSPSVSPTPGGEESPSPTVSEAMLDGTCSVESPCVVELASDPVLEDWLTGVALAAALLVAFTGLHVVGSWRR